MSRTTALEADELGTMINSFRCSDLVSLLGSVGRNRSGRKQELQVRALQILKDPDPDINLDGFKRKIKELYKAAQDEAKQTHNLELQQQQMMAHNMSGGRMQHVLHANAMQQQRPMNNINPFVAVPTQTYHHQAQRGNLAGSNASVYQGMPSNAYPGANMYGQANTPMQMSQNPPLQNFGNTTLVVTPTYLTYANNVKFRKLPFYNVKHEVLKPIIIVGNSHSSLPTTMRTSATQEFHFSFVLTCDMASDLAMNRDMSNGKNEYNVQAQLRITAFENSATNNIAEYDDYLPLGLVVRLNQRQCTLPMCSPNTRSGTESRRIPRPIGITAQMRMSPMNANHLVINWAVETGKSFVISLNLVEKLSSQYLINKLKEKPTISVDVTKSTIRQQYKRVIDDDDDNDEANADDDDIATTIVRVSLVCPLAKFRMTCPAKGKNCSHLQCFDGAAYVSLNEKKPMWMCPVCNRALYFDDLLIDQYFLDVLQNEQLSPDCQEVQLLVDGTWKSYDEEDDDKQKSGNSASSPQAPSPSTSKQDANATDSVEMIANDDDNDRKVGTPGDLHFDTNAAAGGPVVDLTEEEEEPPENPMDVVSENTEVPADSEAPKTASPPAISPTNNRTTDEQATETTSNVEKTCNEDTNSTPSVVPTTSTAVPTDAPSSTTVSSSGYISPNIISLDDSPSPSPPRVPASPQNAIAQLNIEDS